ncbi:MAG: electron transport complex subunit RsxA [Clostridia bacterium]|uniref:electron transport complex protein RnfA n=1 Tax=Pumilibacter muris TaxID=2941510 RepID=UPI002040B982|nr:Rnf-Nqr domain containing protein [Pumilibacter muris]MCI8595630.1 electron transport complex subunit RsxA [Clostridia bacterium]
MSVASIITIVVSAILTDNIVLSKTLGICPLLGTSKKTDSAVGMGLAVTFVITVSSIVCYGLFKLLDFWNITYLQTIVFILVIASLVQLLDIVLKRFSPTLYNSLGIYLALITTNCTVLGSANMVIDYGYNLLETFVFGFFTGIGFTMVLILMSGIREKLNRTHIPKPFAGFPIALIIAGILAMAFGGFTGFSF